MTAIEFLTRVPLRQEFVLLSSVLGVTALVDALNNPPVGTATESSILGPFFTEDAPNGALHFDDLSSPFADHRPAWLLQSRSASRSLLRGRESICMSKDTCAIPAARPFLARSSIHGRRTIKVSADASFVFFFSFDTRCCAAPLTGLYDIQYADRLVPDCRGRLVTDQNGKYAYRAVVPISYPIPIDVSSFFWAGFFRLLPAAFNLAAFLSPRAPTLRFALPFLAFFGLSDTNSPAPGG
jgi:hypothetical protein